MLTANPVILHHLKNQKAGRRLYNLNGQMLTSTRQHGQKTGE